MWLPTQFSSWQSRRTVKGPAILASLTSTCRRHNLDPQLYLTQLLINLPSANIKQLPAWLPDQWKLQQSPLLTNIQKPCSRKARI